MNNKEIYQDKYGNLYFVEYDQNGQPYQVFCDENGVPLQYEEEVAPVAPAPSFIPPINQPQQFVQENKKKSKGWLVALISILVVALLGVAGYFGYTKYFNAKPVTDISNYEINFVAYGVDGEGKPSVDIQKIPVTKNAKDLESAIDEVLKNPTITYDKQDGLKNGDKVEVTITIPENSAKKYNLQVQGEFKKTYTVTGLTAKPVEKIVVQEKSTSDSSSSANTNNDISRKDERTRYVIPAAGVNLRAQPNDDSEILTTARQGNSVYQTEIRQNDRGEWWARVTYNGRTGWMRADLLN